MHIGLFLGDFQPGVGGGYTFVKEVVESFVLVAGESYHRFTIICLPTTATYFESSNLPSNISLAQINVSKLWTSIELRLARFSDFLGFFWPSRLETLSREHGIELVWFVGCVPTVMDIPYIATVWDVQHLTDPWFPEVSAKGEWYARDSLLQIALRRATKIITGTVVGKQELEFFYRIPGDRVKILPHPTPKFALEPIQQSGESSIALLDLDKDFVLYPAQFWAHKNHINLLIGFKMLLESQPKELDLVFVGSDRGNQDFVRARVDQLGLTHQVKFLGFVSLEELISLYRFAIALVYSSFSGPENLPPLEAFALGCPVITSDFPGAREQLGEAAHFFNPHEPKSIANAIYKVMSDDNYKNTLIKLGLERANSWTGLDYARGALDLIDELESIRGTWQ